MIPRFEDEAQEEYRAAIEYSEREFGLGEKFITLMEAALDEIASDPKRFRVFRKKYHIFQMARRPYYLVYMHADDFIHIYAVAHTSRRPQYWLERLPR